MKNNKVLVIGDLMIDHYLWGNCERISPEAPVQVVDIKNDTKVLGGAGNVVHNLKSLELDVHVLSIVGNDNVADEIETMFENIKVGKTLIKDNSRITSKKTRIIASHQQVVRYDEETKNEISIEFEQELFNEFKFLVDDFSIIILSDYGKGVLTENLIQEIIIYANKNNIKVLVDPKGEDFSKYKGAYLITPNKNEVQKATKITIKDDKTLLEALEFLKHNIKVAIPMITLSENGIVILNEENTMVKKPTAAREVFDVTGAGDTVISALAYGLIYNDNIEDILEFANLAAGVVVGKLGSATATLEEIEEYKSSFHKSNINNHIKNFDEISTIVTRLRSKGKSIVFTNGCFDILHKGHVSYLNKAKSFGDILIVGLNSDFSVRRLKGETRPINEEYDRAYVLGALESVDYVVVFNDDTPYELIKLVQPDILVKGADYKDKVVVGSDIVEKLCLVDFIEGKSTSKIIESINKKGDKNV